MSGYTHWSPTLFMYICMYIIIHSSYMVYTCSNYHLTSSGLHCYMLCICIQVGAAFRPNPGQCELEPRTENGMNFLEYTEDRVYVSYYIYMCVCVVGACLLACVCICA